MALLKAGSKMNNIDLVDVSSAQILTNKSVGTPAAGDSSTKIANTAWINGNSLTATTAAMTLYVDAVNGNDSNSGTAAGAGNALATINAAINKVPKIIRHNVTINVAAGTYSGDMIVSGFIGGDTSVGSGSSVTLTIIGDTNNTARSRIVSGNIQVINNGVNVFIQGITSTMTAGPAFSIISNSNVSLLDCVIVTSASQIGFYIVSSSVLLSNCVASNRYYVLQALSQSYVYCLNMQGSGNTMGISPQGASIILKQGGTYTSTNGDVVSGGGSIVNTSFASTNSPAFTGTPTAPTPTAGDNSTRVPTTAFVQTAVAGAANMTAATITVAASNSHNKSRSDYQCTGTNDHNTINTAIGALPVITIDSGTAQAGASNTITLASTASPIDQYYIGCTIEITSGTGSGQSRSIGGVGGYVGGTKVATVTSAWTTQPDNTSVYTIKSPFGKVVLLEGIYNVSATIQVPSNVTLEGQGAGTVLRVIDASVPSTFTIITNKQGTNGDSGIVVRNLKLDGNKANHTGITIGGISIQRCFFSAIEGCTLGNLTGIGIYVNSGENNSVRNNTCYNASTGITVGTSNNVTVLNNTMIGNVTYGLSIASSTNCSIIGNVITTNVGKGMYINVSNYNSVSGNMFYNNGEEGLNLNVSFNNLLQGNVFIGSSQKTNNTYDHLTVGLLSTGNTIQGNTFKAGTLTNKPRYALYLDALATDTSIIGNDFTDGAATDDISRAYNATLSANRYMNKSINSGSNWGMF